MLTSDSSTSVTIDGTTITARLPFYLFMYPVLDPSLVVDAVLACENKVGTARINTGIPLSQATIHDVTNALLTTKLCKCKCGKTAFHKSMDTNRKGQCELCFLKDLTDECNKITAKENKKQLARDKKMYAAGHRFRVEAWIHPIAGGDDYVLRFYSKEKLTDAKIKSQIKKERSIRTDDYTVTELVDCI